MSQTDILGSRSYGWPRILHFKLFLSIDMQKKLIFLSSFCIELRWNNSLLIRNIFYRIF